MSTKKRDLTPRQKEIIRILADFPAETPATAADISQQLSISTRTVLREMPTIETWLSENQFQFIRKPGVGLALVGQLDGLANLLDGSGQSQGYSKEARRHRLLSELLTNQEPVKSQVLTKLFQISEGTLVGDLDYAKQWFSNYGVILHRRPGLGIYIEASEPHLRHAIVGVLLEDLQESVALDLLEGVHPLVLPQTMTQVADALTAVSQCHDFHYTDRGYTALSLYLAVSAQRIEQGHLCQRPSSEQELQEYPIATAIAQQLDLPQEEIPWIARELVSAIQRREDTQAADQTETIPLRQLVHQLMDSVERSLSLTFQGRDMLVSDLMRHMEPALCRLELGIPVKNTHIQEIKTQYPTIYQATQAACQLLCLPTGSTFIPESEVAFIAMHFCAAMERMQTAQRNIRAVIACPTGVGMSRILAANLAKHFKEIEIRDVVSVMRLSPDWLSEQGIDLVISTVKLTVDYPYICVHPGLRHQDRVLLSEVCQRLSTQPAPSVPLAPQQFQLRSAIDYLDGLGQEILRLVSRVTLHLMAGAENKSQLISVAAGLFTQDAAQQATIFRDLEARELISETYINEGQMLLLHCRTSAVTCCQLGYIRLATPCQAGDNPVSGAIVMLIPQNPNSVLVEMMGQISAAFLDNQGLYLAVQQGGVNDFSFEVEKILSRYYRKILRQLSDYEV